MLGAPCSAVVAFDALPAFGTGGSGSSPVAGDDTRLLLMCRMKDVGAHQ